MEPADVRSSFEANFNIEQNKNSILAKHDNRKPLNRTN